MKQILIKAVRQSIVLLAILVVACEQEEGGLPEVVAGFTQTVNVNTGTVTFFNTSTNATQYLWDFGDGTTSTEINPIKVFVSGSYVIKLRASNVAGAFSMFEDNVTIEITTMPALPITFDLNTVNYDATVFGGADFAVVDNPSVSGSNNKNSKVGSVINSGAAFEGLFFDLGAAIDLTTDKRITMNFWSEAPIGVLLKLEGTNPSIEKTSNHGGTGWEAISFDFTSSSQYQKLTLFVDGPGTTAGTFYFDDIIQEATPVSSNGCTGTLVAAPSLPLDFEECKTFLSSENFGAGITSQLEANPFKTGINTSNYVLKVDKPTGSDFYAGIQNTFASNFNLTTTNTFKVKVYSTKANVVFRFELAVNPQTVPVTGNPAPVFQTITNANQWTEVSVTFTGLPGGPTAYNQLVIKPDNTMADSPITSGATYYIDDLTLSAGGGGGTAPTVAAPTPPGRNPADVISIFSGAYTNIAGVEYNPNWGQGTVTTTVDIAGNATLKYANLNYQGTDFSGNAQNVSTMQFLHIDFWTANSTALNAFIISTGPVEKAKVLTVPTGGNWTSLDIPLADFSPVNLANIIQFKFDGNGDIYLDNMYFYKSGAPLTSPATPAPTPPARAAGDVISIFSNAYTNIAGVDYNPNWGQGTVATTIDIAGNATLKYANLNYQGTDFSGNAQNTSAMQFLHVDFWTANSTALNVSIISSGPLEKAKALTVPTGGNWTSINIPLADFAPPVNLANIIQFKFDGNGDVFLDNLYFYKAAVGGGSLITNGDFETGTDSGWIRFQNGGTSVLDNTTNNGGSWSGKLATGGPSNPAFKQERFGAGIVMAGDVVQVKFDHKGSVVQPGAVFNVLLFGEGAGPGASFTHVFNPAPTLSAGWTTFTRTFTIAPGTDVSSGISLLIEAVCGGDAGCSVMANIDNVSVTLNP